METKTQYTPGPWTRRGEQVVAHRPHAVTSGINEESVFAMTRKPAEREANARLIAAAPDLLEACKAIQNDPLQYDAEIDGGPRIISEQQYRALEAAIAKAEGR